MCGIAGYWKPGGLSDNHQPELRNMIETLKHRGPDGFGFHVDSENGIAMAHARLSIIDLETGDQPLYGEGEDQVLTVNGEFYNYKRIRTRLRLEGANFRTRSDSEIALPLYNKHGLDLVDHLRGEFAFTLYDRKRQQLVLVRDRFGVRPLFYHVKGDAIYWGSEVKALFAHPEIPREFSSEGILHQLMHTMVPGTSAYKDVHALKPGHMLVVRREGSRIKVQERRYWDMNFPREQDRDPLFNPAYFIEQVQHELMEAVRFRLEADVPVGCYLSGGIDSCSMLGLASSMQQSPVKAFTISFDNQDYDESGIARQMAERTNADQEQINLGAAELYGENYVRTLYHAERTFYNTLGVAKWCMSKRVNECGFRVVVTGEGSDELFGGYPAFKRDVFLHDETRDESTLRQRTQAMEESNRLFKGAILPDEPVSHPAMDALCGFTPSWIQPWIKTLALARPLLNDDLLETLKSYDPVEAIAASFDRDQIKDRHVLDKVQYTWNKTMLECQILSWGGDRVDMAHHMESRPAFLDHHVAALAHNIHPKLRINGTTEKWVLREAMKNILPDVLYKREKFAFMAPPGHTAKDKKSALELLIAEYLSEDSVKNVGIIHPKRLKTFLEEYRHDQDPSSLTRKDALINHLVGLHILHEQFIHQVEPVSS